MTGATHFCRDCGAPVRWVTSEKGRRFPIDPSSDSRGTFLLEPRPDASGKKRLVAVGLDEKERVVETAKGTLLFRHHRAVCNPRSGAGSPPPPGAREEIDQILARARRRR